jgi:GT2 family glycosyltransferase
MKSYAVIIVAYLKDQELDRLLQRVMAIKQKSIHQMELCVVHNGGCEQSKKKYQDQLIWWDAVRNIGASAGRNQGVRLTHAPWIVFLDDDGIVDWDFFDRLAQVIDQNHDLMAVRGKVLPLFYPWISSIAKHYDRGDQLCEDMLVIEGATGIKRDVYESVNGYDEEIFGNEGIELSYRMKMKFPEFKIYYSSEMLFYHDFAAGFGGLWRKSKRMVDSQLKNESKLKLALGAYREIKIEDKRKGIDRVRGWLMTRIYRLMIWVRGWGI